MATAMETAIRKNRIRESRRDKAERMLRKMRQRIFDYDDAGLGDKAARVMARCKAILALLWNARAEARKVAAENRLMRTWE